jgi:hypothetical protein
MNRGECRMLCYKSPLKPLGKLVTAQGHDYDQDMDDIKKQPEPNKPMPPAVPASPQEIGGRGGLDPARYGDWENNGKCVDF